LSNQVDTQIITRYNFGGLHAKYCLPSIGHALILVFLNLWRVFQDPTCDEKILYVSILTVRIVHELDF